MRQSGARGGGARERERERAMEMGMTAVQNISFCLHPSLSLSPSFFFARKEKKVFALSSKKREEKEMEADVPPLGNSVELEERTERRERGEGGEGRGRKNIFDTSRPPRRRKNRGRKRKKEGRKQATTLLTSAGTHESPPLSPRFCADCAEQRCYYYYGTMNRDATILLL